MRPSLSGPYYGMPSVRLSVRPFGPVGSRTEARRNFIFRLEEIQSLAHVIDILIFLTERSQTKSHGRLNFYNCIELYYDFMYRIIILCF